MAHLTADLSPMERYDAERLLDAVVRIAGKTATVTTMKTLRGGRRLEVRWNGLRGGALNLEIVQRIQSDLARRGVEMYSLELNGQPRNPDDVWKVL